MKISGPYIFNTGKLKGRRYLIVTKENKHTTKLFSRWLMEQYIGRELATNEHVDHINRDFTDDRIENLRVVDNVQHLKEDAYRVKLVEITCVWCGGKSYKSARNMNHNSNLGNAGPFCSKSCAGTYSQQLQYGKTTKLPIQPKIPIDDRVYYYPEKSIISQPLTVSKEKELCIQELLAKKPRKIVHKSYKKIPTIRVKKPDKHCHDCGKKINRKATRCKSCALKFHLPTKITWPSTAELIEMINKSSYLAISKQLGVSDSAVRKRIVNHPIQNDYCI